MRRAVYLLALFLFASSAFAACPADWASVQASKIMDLSGSLLASGTFSISGVDAKRSVINFSAPGGGVVMRVYKKAPVANGAIVGEVCVPRSDKASVYVRYHVVVTDNGSSGTHAVVVDANDIAITADVFSLDAYAYPADAYANPPSVFTSGSVTGDLHVTGTVYAGTIEGATAAHADHATTADSATTATTATTATNATHATTADSATTAATATTATTATTAASATVASALAATPTDCGTEAINGINADGSPKSCIPAGTGVDPVGATYELQTKASDSSLGGSGILSDGTTAVANLPFSAKIMDGTLNTTRYATSSSSNDGISNALASSDCASGCTIAVPPTSTDTELPVMPSQDNSALVDRRGGRFLRAIKNPSVTPCTLSGGGDASGDCVNLLINNQTLRGYAHNTYMKYAGPGFNLGYSPASPISGMTVNQAYQTYFEADTRGIKQVRGDTLVTHGIGDTALHYGYLYTDGGQTDGSGEANIGASYLVNENITYYHGTITGGAATGSVLLTTHNTAGQNAFTDGGYLLDITQGGTVTGTIASTVNVDGVGVWNMTGASMPVSTAWGTFTSDSTSTGQYQVAQSQTETVALSGDSPGAFVVGNNACIVGAFFEQVPITAVGAVTDGTQSITYSTRYGWKGTGSYPAFIMQGGMCGQYLTNTANATWRTAIAAVGSFSSTQVVLGACSHGYCNNAFSQLAFVVGTTGDSITQYPGAEIIGTNGKGAVSNQVQLGFNTAPWTNGDVIEGPHPPAVNMNALKIYASQKTKANNAGSNLFVESWNGVNPGGSLGLNQTFLNLSDSSTLQWFWRIVSSDSTGKMGTLFQVDVPTNVMLSSIAPAQDIEVFDAYQPAGASARTRIVSHGTTGDFAFMKNTSGLALITAGNVPPVGTVGQIPVVTSTATSGQNYNPVSVSGDATFASTGALTLATVNSGPGSCGDATHVCAVTTDAQGPRHQPIGGRDHDDNHRL
ncbi:MAG: hypothetical protein BGO25_05780 [Acidobacteriales bacterium 59-55]|nr:hypothetical protein [Terriglobales bacterium]OJV44592.1 MAG: hypothetical protein BGO25_05780 [Acidobacteriales bacterium 59-55]